MLMHCWKKLRAITVVVVVDDDDVDSEAIIKGGDYIKINDKMNTN